VIKLIFQGIAVILIELIKHYSDKLKRTSVDGAGSGQREKRLRDKIRMELNKRK